MTEGETSETKDESTAYLEFLNEEVCVTTCSTRHEIYANSHCLQAQKFSRAIDDVEEDDLGEDSVLLESPLDKIEPYQLFRATLLSMCHPNQDYLS